MEKLEIAVFAGGCFWCTEAVFKMLNGVIGVTPGYTGGFSEDSSRAPTYEDVCSGRTGHAEAVEIKFDSSLIKFTDLLTVFFATHDPTAKNMQWNDVGSQYRSAIFFTTSDQKREAEDFIKELNESSKEGKPIVTEVEPLKIFYSAEDYHKDFFAKHPENPYCEVVINPKLEKVQKDFEKFLK